MSIYDKLRTYGFTDNMRRQLNYETKVRQNNNTSQRVSEFNSDMLGIPTSYGNMTYNTVLSQLKRGVSPIEILGNYKQERQHYEKTGRTIEFDGAVQSLKETVSSITGTHKENITIDEYNFSELSGYVSEYMKYENAIESGEVNNLKSVDNAQMMLLEKIKELI